MSLSHIPNLPIAPPAKLTSPLASLEIAPAPDSPAVARAHQQRSPARVLYKLEAIPLDFRLIGRERELERTFDLLTDRAAGNSTGHVAIVGLGGIGKTSLATKIAHDPRSKAFGRPVFIRCERLDTLVDFQFSLLRLRAPKALRLNEDLEGAVRRELEKVPLFLILDNLLDSADASHSSYLQFIDSISRIPTLTLLLTSLNHTFINESASLQINSVQLGGLDAVAAEELFRNEYRRVDSELTLEPDEPDMAELLKLLDGVPLAIVLVAAHARKAQSLADVIRRWKDMRAWDNGAHGRLTSLEASLEISLSDQRIVTTDAIHVLQHLRWRRSQNVDISAVDDSPVVPV
ncbi:hypothetical protein RQP46_007616 [Phenoliferia psychrophenolica]